MRPFLLVVLVTISGCNADRGYSIQDKGNGSFTIFAPRLDPSEPAEHLRLFAANNAFIFCERKGERLRLIAERSTSKADSGTPVGIELTFACY